MKGLVLAGSHGTRLRPLTFTGNKHMIPIANKPMIFYGLEHLAKAGINEIGVILGPIREGVRETIGDGSAFGLKITYIEQPDPKGLAHAVLIAEDFLKSDPFVIYLGNNLLKQGVRPLINAYFNHSSDLLLLLFLTPLATKMTFQHYCLNRARIDHFNPTCHLDYFSMRLLSSISESALYD